MHGLVIRWLVSAVSLWLTSKVIPGFSFDGVFPLLFAAVTIGLLNAIVRPIVFILTLPLTIVTLGLFLLIVNAMMIGLVDLLLGGFDVRGLFAGIMAAIVTGVASWIGGMILRDDRR